MQSQRAASIGGVGLVLGHILLALGLLLGCEATGGAGGARKDLCTAESPYDCEPCFFDAECGSGQCRDGACAVAVACESANDCPKAAPACAVTGTCGECATDRDCGANGVCTGGECATHCEGLEDCGEGQLCDANLEVCVQCSGDGDCPESLSCEHNRCVADSCKPGAGRCDPTVNAVWTCAESGGREEVFLCPDGKHCKEAAEDEAECAPQLCEPNSKSCNADGVTLETCSETGLAIGKLNCAAKGGACLNGACVDVVCPPGEKQCAGEGATILVCSSNGTELNIEEVCDPEEYCDADSTTCQADNCVAHEAMCDGNVATTCEFDGSGPSAEGTDCGSKKCVDGECREVLCKGDYVCKDGDVFRCTESGTVLTLNDSCGYGEYCNAGVSTCQPTVCAAEQPYCDGNAAAVCNSDGSGPVSPGTACGSEICVDGECLPTICEPYSYLCENNDVYYCDYGGAVKSPIRDCSDSQYCSPGSSSCFQDLCTGGQPYCQGNSIVQCREDGSGPTADPSQSCGNKVCRNGGCLDKICTGYHCGSDGHVYSCSSDGLTESLYDYCESNQYCVDGVAGCQWQMCTPGQQYCSGNNVVTCNSIGSAFVDAGVSCGANEACEAGQCKPVICTPGYSCNGQNLNYCNYAGTGEATWATCGINQICDASWGSCRTKVCEPNTNYCSNGRVYTCDSNGTGNTGSSVACGSGTSCLDGVCQPQTCQPYTTTCRDGALKVCPADGLSWSPASPCSGGLVCPDGYSYCTWPICTPGEYSCKYQGYSSQDNEVRLCNSGGWGFVSATPCPLGNMCNTGECYPIACEWNEAKCATSTSVQYCADDQRAFDPPVDCSPGDLCLETTGNCGPALCTPDQPSCALGEQPSICNSIGNGYANQSAPCEGTDVCDLQGCAGSATDGPAGAGTLAVSAGSELSYIQYFVTNSRVLTKIEAQIEAANDTVVHWVVYGGGGGGQPYLIFEEISALSGPGQMLIERPVSLTLWEGYYYTIGVFLEGGSTVNQASGLLDTASLGRPIGSGRLITPALPQYLPASMNPYGYPVLRITTERAQ